VRVNISVVQPDGAEVHLEAQPSLQQAGLFKALHVSRLPGPYVAKIEIPASDQEPAQKTEIGWTSEPAAEEFQQSTVNVALLEEIARKSGGAVVSSDRLDDFVANLVHRDLPRTEIETVPLWHRPWLLLAVLTLLAAEWGLRRWRGLA
jgi:hypothetical protein